MQSNSNKLPDKALMIYREFVSTLPAADQKPALAKVEGITSIVTEELGLGIVSMAACYLTMPFNAGWLDGGRVLEQFPRTVLAILEGLKKIESLNTSRTRIHADKFIQLLLSISNDVRVILIKTGERLYEIRKIEDLSDDDSKKLAHEAGDLFAPIAHRLGLYLIKSELEEVSMKYLRSDIHRDISRKLDETRTNREDFISRFIGPLKQELESRGYPCEIKGRTKSIPSIWRKMVQQGVDFEEVYDLFAIRIILMNSSDHEKADCWQVYSIVTDYYKPNPERLRDWISAPKPNGYESLHTTVSGPEGRWVEVQIRTKQMDETAEKGHAAHWRYKENSGETEGTDWLTEIRNALEAPDFVKNVEEIRSKNELYSNQIYVFTPDGDLLKLSKGATVLDFAFAVHSEVGYHCTGARVNGQIVPIRHKLVNGDQIVVLTSVQQKPNLSWLNLVSTSKAKTRIKRFLKEAEYQNADMGKEILERKLEQWRIKADVSTVQRIVNWLNLKDVMVLYQQIAENRIDLASIREFLRDKAPAELLKEKTSATKTIEGYAKAAGIDKDYLIIDDRLDRVDYRMAKCCNPIFGDEVFGFVTVKEGTKIHRVNCPNARELIARFPYRVVKVRWTDSHGQVPGFTVNVLISGKDDIAVVNEISRLISTDLKITMRAMNLVPKNGFFEGVYTLAVQDRSHLEIIMNRIRRIKGILTVRRSDEQA